MPELEHDIEDWKTQRKVGAQVEVKVLPKVTPVVCAVFDGDEIVTEKTAALQLDEQIWAAQGYKKAKEKYGIPTEDFME